MRSPRFIALLLSSLFFSAFIPSISYAAITAKKVPPLFQVPSDIRAISSDQQSFALVGDSIHLLPRQARSFDEARTISSSAKLFTDVTSSKSDFFAVGVAESAVVISRELPTEVLNPDSITVAAKSEIPVGLTRLVISQFSIRSETATETIYDLDRPLIPAEILVTSDRIGVVGSVASDLGRQGFLALISRSSGEFSFFTFGSSGTSINSLANLSTLYGMSDERLAGSDRRGLRDGVIFYLDKRSTLTRVIRSFQASTAREWSKVSSSHLAVGSAVRGKTSEVAVTKFTAKGEPSWFFRLPGREGSLSGSTVGMITTQKIPGISNFAPRAPAAIFISLDMKKKGAFRGALSIPARTLKDMNDGLALVVDREGLTQVIPLSF